MTPPETENPTRQRWAAIFSKRKSELDVEVNEDLDAYKGLFDSVSNTRWSALILLGEGLHVDWDSLKPEPLPLDQVQSYQVLDCTTDLQAAKLVQLLKKAGKKLHPNVDSKAGAYHTFGEMAAKIDENTRFKGYQILPAYMFI